MSDPCLVAGCVAPMLSLSNKGRWVGSPGPPGKPLYALKQRLVSSTITAPPICMSQHAVTLIQAALLHGQAAAQVKGTASETPAQQLVCISLWQCLLVLPVMQHDLAQTFLEHRLQRQAAQTLRQCPPAALGGQHPPCGP